MKHMKVELSCSPLVGGPKCHLPPLFSALLTGSVLAALFPHCLTCWEENLKVSRLDDFNTCLHTCMQIHYDANRVAVWERESCPIIPSGSGRDTLSSQAQLYFGRVRSSGDGQSESLLKINMGWIPGENPSAQNTSPFLLERRNISGNSNIYITLWSSLKRTAHYRWHKIQSSNTGCVYRLPIN